MDVSGLVQRVRRPAHTGENRCLPCTVVNTGLAVLGAGVLAWLTSLWVGVVWLAVACVTIALRGYLVPGTPALTERYFPPWLLALFGKESIEATTTGGVEVGDAENPLVAHGIVTRTDEGPALRPSFREDWRARTTDILAAGTDPGTVAAAFDADEVKRLGDTSFVLDGTRSVRWGSETALAADLAAAELLSDRVDVWPTFDHDRRRSVLQGLRLSLDRCPQCDELLSVETDRVDPCCQKPHLVAESVCESCDAAIGDAAVVDTAEHDSVPAALLAV